MSEADCPNCGKHYKNIGAHARYCKPKDQVVVQPHSIEEKKEEVKPVEHKPTIIRTSWLERRIRDIKKMMTKKKVLSTDEIKTMRIDTINLTEEQKFKQFFMNLPTWTHKKPGIIEKMKLGNSFRHCVFVSRDPNVEDTEAFVPYNTNLRLLCTDTGFYDMPVKEKGTIYLDIDKFRPIINGDDYSKEFDIPEDFAISLLSRGIDFGQLAQFKDLINEIKTDRMIKMVCIGVTALALIALFLVVYSDNKAVKLLADQVGTLSTVVGSLK